MHGALLASALTEAVVEGGVVAVGIAADVASRLDQDGAQPAIAHAGPARVAFAGALVVARRDLGPRRDVPMGGPAAHVHPDLGQDFLHRAAAQAPNRVQVIDDLLKRARPFLDLAWWRSPTASWWPSTT